MLVIILFSFAWHYSSSVNRTNSPEYNTTWPSPTTRWSPNITASNLGHTAWPYIRFVNRTTSSKYNTTWPSRASTWAPRITVWSPTPRYQATSAKVICNNYRDPGSKEFPKVGDLFCVVNTDRYYMRDDPDDELLSRETVVRSTTDQRVERYDKMVRGTVSRVSVLNLGDRHAFVEQIYILNLIGWSAQAGVHVRIQPLEGQDVKLFVEIYGKKA